MYSVLVAYIRNSISILTISNLRPATSSSTASTRFSLARPMDDLRLYDQRTNLRRSTYIQTCPPLRRSIKIVRIDNLRPRGPRVATSLLGAVRRSKTAEMEAAVAAVVTAAVAAAAAVAATAMPMAHTFMNNNSNNVEQKPPHAAEAAGVRNCRAFRRPGESPKRFTEGRRPREGLIAADPGRVRCADVPILSRQEKTLVTSPHPPRVRSRERNVSP